MLVHVEAEKSIKIVAVNKDMAHEVVVPASYKRSLAGITTSLYMFNKKQAMFCELNRKINRTHKCRHIPRILVINDYKKIFLIGGIYMQQIKKLFESKFAPWEIKVGEEELFIGNKKTMPRKGWRIKWIVGKNERGIYMEFYAVHEQNGHLHERIYESGEEEELDVLKQYIVYEPNIPGDRERSTIEFENYNKGLIKQLEERGIF